MRRGLGSVAMAAAWCIGMAACGGDEAGQGEDAAADTNAGDALQDALEGDIGPDVAPPDADPPDGDLPDAPPSDTAADGLTDTEPPDGAAPDTADADDATPPSDTALPDAGDTDTADTSDTTGPTDTTSDTVGDTTADPCDGVSCGDHGRCVADPTARCDCDPDYRAEGLDCVPDLVPARFANLPATVQTDVTRDGAFTIALEDAARVGPHTFAVDDDGCGLSPSVNASGDVSWRCPATSRTCGITVTVTQDGAETDRDLLTVECRAGAPTFTGAAPSSAAEGTAYAWTPACVDPNGLAVTLAVATADTCGGTLVSGVYRFTPDEDDGGTSCVVAVTCDNGDVESTATRTVSIAEVNAAPAFTNLPSASSARWGRGGAFTALATDPDRPAQALTFSLASSTCSFSVAVATQTGAVSYTCAQRVETCAASLSVTDGALSASSTLSIACTNTLPVVANVAVSPSTAYRNSRLTCSYDFADADGDTDTSRIAWTIDGRAGVLGTSATLEGAFVAGDVVRCTVTPNDGLADGSAMSAAVTIQNRAPSVSNVAVAPTTAYRNTPLTCSYNFSDADGDDNTSRVAWTIDGRAGVLGTGAELTSGYLAGDVVRCTVTPNDGIDDGTAVSAAVTIQNRAPSVSNVAVAPATAYRNTPLTCSYSFSDPDGDGDASRIAWTIDGRAGVLGTGAELTGGYLAGDVVRCTVTPNDGIVDGTAVSAAVTIQNRAPSATNVAVAPATAYRNTPLDCSYSFSDPDGDGDSSRIAWTIDGQAGVLGTGAELTGGYVAGDVVRCTVTPNDGIDDGTAVSATVTIGNRLPVVSAVVLSPAAPTTPGEPLTCDYTFADADGDDDASTIEWLIEGVPLATGATFSDHLPGDRVRCRVTAGDGVESGNVELSEEIVAPGRVVRAAFGLNHACAIEDGALSCWGSNTSRQLGDGSTTSRHTPAVVPGFEAGTEAVVVGHNHTCALKSGVVSCWGANEDGQLGRTPSTSEAKPADVSLPAPATALAAGANFTCAVADGAVHCWGQNTRGQLGTGDKLGTHVPTLVEGLPGGATAVSAGIRHTCALADGAAYCWGSNNEGQTGTGSAAIELLEPEPVVGLDAGVTALTSGVSHSCAIADGGLFCWGSNGNGRLGDGTQLSRFTPVAVTDMDSGVTHVAAGISTCATRDRQLFCWGANEDGQLGLGVTSARVLTASAVPGFEAATARVAAGPVTSCAILDEELFCWGRNAAGQLRRPFGPELSPAPFEGGLIFGTISAGTSHACGTEASSGSLYCWGSNQFGQLGIPGTLSHSVPTIVPGFESGVSHVAAGDLHTCVVRDGAAYCWGSNQFGQLGDGTTDARSAPTLVTGLNEGVTRVAATSASSCAVKDGAVFCWGSNVVGQLGDATLIAKLEPVAALDLVENVTEIHGGRSHVCASQGGPLFCWGFNGKGQLGDGTTSNRSRPTAVLNMPAGVSIFGLGHQHTCAIRAGSVFCWGDNQYGQLGDGTAIAKSEPQRVPTQSSLMVALGVGGDHTCATKNRDLSCWGRNDKGQIGDGTTQTRVSPVLILDETGGRHIWLGDDFTCARQNQVSPTRDLCWGENAASQLGRVGPFSEFPL